MATSWHGGQVAAVEVVLASLTLRQAFIELAEAKMPKSFESFTEASWSLFLSDC
jgi:hypothetical protein